MEQEHKHHIVPIYRCKELKLTTSYKVDGKEFYFKENLVKIPRLVHALIHWGYYCKDLSPLLEHCNPPQWVIDMIPLGDIRDMWSAKPLAMGEIDGIDMSGENHPNTTHGRTVGARNDPKIRSSYGKEYRKDTLYDAKRSAKNKEETGYAIGYSRAKKKVKKIPKKKVKKVNKIDKRTAFFKAWQEALWSST